MHPCPDCSQVCRCDGEDVVWFDSIVPDHCDHQCELSEWDCDHPGPYKVSKATKVELEGEKGE